MTKLEKERLEKSIEKARVALAEGLISDDEAGSQLYRMIHYYEDRIRKEYKEEKNMTNIACDCSLCPINRERQCAAKAIHVQALEVLGTEESDDQRTDNIANDLDLHLPVCDQFIVIQDEKEARLPEERTVVHCDIGECIHNEYGECTLDELEVSDQEFYDKLPHPDHAEYYHDNEDFKSDDQPVCMNFVKEDQ